MIPPYFSLTDLPGFSLKYFLLAFSLKSSYSMYTVFSSIICFVPKLMSKGLIGLCINLNSSL